MKKNEIGNEKNKTNQKYICNNYKQKEKEMMKIQLIMIMMQKIMMMEIMI